MRNIYKIVSLGKSLAMDVIGRFAAEFQSLFKILYANPNTVF